MALFADATQSSPCMQEIIQNSVLSPVQNKLIAQREILLVHLEKMHPVAYVMLTTFWKHWKSMTQWNNPGSTSPGVMVWGSNRFFTHSGNFFHTSIFTNPSPPTSSTSFTRESRNISSHGYSQHLDLQNLTTGAAAFHSITMSDIFQKGSLVSRGYQGRSMLRSVKSSWALS